MVLKGGGEKVSPPLDSFPDRTIVTFTDLDGRSAPEVGAGMPGLVTEAIQMCSGPFARPPSPYSVGQRDNVALAGCFSGGAPGIIEG